MTFYNERGTILTEWLVAIFLLLLILHLSFPLFKLMNKPTDDLSSLLFFYHQLEIELQQATEINWDQQSITYTNSTNRTISISAYGQNIRKQVNRQGHEILLRDINGYKVTILDEKFICMIVTLRNGDSYEKIMEIPPTY